MMVLSATLTHDNSPMGVFEFDAFAGGTKSMMNDVVAATERYWSNFKLIMIRGERR